MNREDATRSIQLGLASLGFDPGPLDGISGPRTIAAGKAWQASVVGAGKRLDGTEAVQRGLAALGFDPGPLDGIRGPKTDAAAADWLGPVAVLTDDLPWLTELRKVFGLHETRDKAALSKWLRSDGKTLGAPDALPWCGDAVETATKNSLPDEPFEGALGENPYWAQNWGMFGIPVKPCYGCVGVFKRPSGGHVGFLVGADAKNYFVFGGNQGNAVNIVAIEKTRLLPGDKGTRWPSTFPHEHVSLPKMQVGAIPVSRNEF